mgnify:CR=1 FL=1
MAPGSRANAIKAGPSPTSARVGQGPQLLGCARAHQLMADEGVAFWPSFPSVPSLTLNPPATSEHHHKKQQNQSCPPLPTNLPLRLSNLFSATLNSQIIPTSIQNGQRGKSPDPPPPSSPPFLSSHDITSGSATTLNRQSAQAVSHPPIKDRRKLTCVCRYVAREVCFHRRCRPRASRRCRQTFILPDHQLTDA